MNENKRKNSAGKLIRSREGHIEYIRKIYGAVSGIRAGTVIRPKEVAEITGLDIRTVRDNLNRLDHYAMLVKMYGIIIKRKMGQYCRLGVRISGGRGWRFTRDRIIQAEKNYPTLVAVEAVRGRKRLTDFLTGLYFFKRQFRLLSSILIVTNAEELGEDYPQQLVERYLPGLRIKFVMLKESPDEIDEQIIHEKIVPALRELLTTLK